MTKFESKYKLSTSGVSSAFFSIKHNETVTLDDVIKLNSMLIDNIDVHRICIHTDSSDEFHNMIIAQKKGCEVIVHQHPTKAESYHIMEGVLKLNYFDDKGIVAKRVVLSSEGNLISRVDPGTYHSIEPISDIVIYHESKIGPFIRKKDFIVFEE